MSSSLPHSEKNREKVPQKLCLAVVSPASVSCRSDSREQDRPEGPLGLGGAEGNSSGQQCEGWDHPATLAGGRRGGRELRRRPQRWPAASRSHMLVSAAHTHGRRACPRTHTRPATAEARLQWREPRGDPSNTYNERTAPSPPRGPAPPSEQF